MIIDGNSSIEGESYQPESKCHIWGVSLGFTY